MQGTPFLSMKSAAKRNEEQKELMTGLDSLKV